MKLLKEKIPFSLIFYLILSIFLNTCMQTITLLKQSEIELRQSEQNEIDFYLLEDSLDSQSTKSSKLKK